MKETETMIHQAKEKELQYEYIKQKRMRYIKKKERVVVLRESGCI